MLHQLLKPALLIFGITIPFWIIFRIQLHKNRRQQISFKQEFILFLFYFYITCVIIITLIPTQITRSNNSYTVINIIPVINSVKAIREAYADVNRYNVRPVLNNLVGNIILFFPLGILLPILPFNKISLKKIILIAFLFSLSIEMAQLVSKLFAIYRSVDIDDIILNISGAVLGYVLIGRFLKREQAANKKYD